MLPLVTIAVCTRNRPHVLAECLASLKRIRYPRKEVIVVDNSDNGLAEQVREVVLAHDCRYIYEPKPKLSVAKNVAVRESEGDIIAFTDDDCTVPEDWLERIVKRFSESELNGIGGPDITPETSDKWEKAFGAIQRHMNPLISQHGSVDRIYGCNSAYRKDILISLGGFDESFITTEEIELHWRINKIGGKLIYDPGLIVFHHRRSSLEKYWRQQFNYGLGEAAFFCKYPSATKISNIVAVSSIPTVVFWMLLFLSVSRFFALLLLLASILSIVAVACYIGRKEKNISLFPYVALALVVWIFGQAIGQVIGLLRHMIRTRKPWKEKC